MSEEPDSEVVMAAAGEAAWSPRRWPRRYLSGEGLFAVEGEAEVEGGAAGERSIAETGRWLSSEGFWRLEREESSLEGCE